ncbi:MAG TPA: hypothetical protein VHE30_20325 [Polyangiaceae bacterium]|nr:hypothetical protein [Polyangiaceae bacterium]
MFGRGGLLAFALALCLERPAFGEETHAFRLEYDAPAGCPRAEGFSRAILSSSARAHAAAEGEASTLVAVHIVPEAGGYLGLLGLRRPDGTESTRAVPAASCDEAASALALIAAIAVDPEASVPKAGPGAIGAFDAPAAPVAPPPVAPPPPASPPLPAPPPPREPVERGRDLVAEVFVGGGVVGAVGPKLSPELVLPGIGVGLNGEDAFSPWIALSGHLAESVVASTPRGNAQFERLGARLTACPLRLARGVASFRPCALAELGRHHAKGESTKNAGTVNLTWSALGLVGRGELDLPASLSVGLELGAIFPLLRDSFRFDPDDTVAHTIPSAGFVGGMFAAFRIQ